MDTPAFFATSATAKSFLDFPTAVCNTIYHLAVLDHDLGAVFLPRSVQRKITSDTNDDVDSVDEDVAEHRDWFEEVGEQYEPHQPAILLTSKQIREECLPIYFATNSFSWRFLWRDYKRSAARFVKWTGTLRDQDAALIKSITFEGRHTVEEGVGFDIDIDLLSSSPCFKFKINCSDVDYSDGEEAYDYTIARIIRYLEREMHEALWKLSRKGQQQVRFSPRDIANLGRLFVKYMQWDPADPTA